MTRNQKRLHKVAMLRMISEEVLSHIENGSEWLYNDFEADNEPWPEDVARFRESILKHVAASLMSRSDRMVGKR